PRQDVYVVGGEIDRHPDVADPGREGSGPARRDRIDLLEPAVAEEPIELEHGRVEPLDVADLDEPPTASGPGDDLLALLDVRRDRLLDQDRDVPVERLEGERSMGRRRRRDHEGVEIAL